MQLLAVVTALLAGVVARRATYRKPDPTQVRGGGL